ncbi:hypothetical protein JKP88DRAFT_317084, partial [Tribonema minus]
ARAGLALRRRHSARVRQQKDRHSAAKAPLCLCAMSAAVNAPLRLGMSLMAPYKHEPLHSPDPSVDTDEFYDAYSSPPSSRPSRAAAAASAASPRLTAGVQPYLCKPQQCQTQQLGQSVLGPRGSTCDDACRLLGLSDRNWGSADNDNSDGHRSV